MYFFAQNSKDSISLRFSISANKPEISSIKLFVINKGKGKKNIGYTKIHRNVIANRNLL